MVAAQPGARLGFCEAKPLKQCERARSRVTEVPSHLNAELEQC
jgi:hypothetical protein